MASLHQFDTEEPEHKEPPTHRGDADAGSDDDGNDAEDERADYMEDAPYGMVRQMFSYQSASRMGSNLWVFCDCELNDTLEPFPCGTHVDVVAVNVSTGIMSVTPSVESHHEIHEYHLVVAAVPVEQYEHDEVDEPDEPDEPDGATAAQEFEGQS